MARAAIPRHLLLHLLPRIPIPRRHFSKTEFVACTRAPNPSDGPATAGIGTDKVCSRVVLIGRAASRKEREIDEIWRFSRFDYLPVPEQSVPEKSVRKGADSSGQQVENIFHPKTRPPKARTTATLIRMKGDTFGQRRIRHDPRLPVMAV